MNDLSLSLQDQIRQVLKQTPECTASQLQVATGKSQPSISLALTALGLGERSGEVQRLGAARSTRYALRQSILGLPAQHDVLFDGPGGESRHFGVLTYLHGDRVHVRSQRKEWLVQGGLPWFLTPLQPQGFLGRELARWRPDFPDDPERWSLAQVLYMAVNHVREPIGAFYLDGPARRSAELAWDSESATLRGAHESLADACLRLAQRVGTGLPAGSLAAGVQPKFLLREPDGARWLVKFSPPRGTPFGERWHALLHLEKLALDVLGEHGVAHADTQVLETPLRTFLLSRRFDRHARSGWRHVVAAAAVHDHFVHAPRQHWISTCRALVKLGMLSADGLESVVHAYLFCQLIGNTDMHFGNLSFLVDDVSRPRFEPAPMYDMLPMMWRPSVHSGSLDAQPLRPPVLVLGCEAQAQVVRGWAVDYWQRACAMATLGPDLQAACTVNAQRVQTGFAGF